MTRLYLRIYLTVVASLLVFAFAVAWVWHHNNGPAMQARMPHGVHAPLHVLLASLLTLGAIVGVLAFPVVRRITGRLERLQQAVESLGAGDLRTRVAVEGRDEVARLALSFNQAAERIEALVGHQKTLLANASHELRTPLTRIRLALELIGPSVDDARRDGLRQDIGELDALIDEILLTSRLEALPHLEVAENVDLLALAAEECARRDGVDLEGTSATVKGDPRLLLRLLRNLLDNAGRHGMPPIQVRLRVVDGVAELAVRDHGTGLPPDEFDRIFEPFYRCRAARDRAGTGLGLALARQIARHHSGELVCRYEPDGAFAFVVSIPVM